MGNNEHGKYTTAKGRDAEYEVEDGNGDENGNGDEGKVGMGKRVGMGMEMEMRMEMRMGMGMEKRMGIRMGMRMELRMSRWNMICLPLVIVTEVCSFLGSSQLLAVLLFGQIHDLSTAGTGRNIYINQRLIRFEKSWEAQIACAVSSPLSSKDRPGRSVL